MAHADGFDQIFIQAQGARDGARNLRDFERVRHARAIMIAFGRDENLRFVLETPKGFAVNDAVAVALPLRAHGVFGFGHSAPVRACRMGRARIEPHFFALFSSATQE